MLRPGTRIVLLLLLAAPFCQAQKSASFSGKITYTWEYQNAPTYTVAYQRNYSVLHIQGTNVRLTEEDKYLRLTDYYFDTKAKTLRKPETVKDERIELVLDADMSQVTGSLFKNLTSTSETKAIAGYTCKKATGNTKVGESTIVTEVWYTEELQVQNSKLLWADLPGVPLEFSNTLGNFVTRQTVKLVEPGPVDPKLFVKPAGLTPMTPQERSNFEFGGDGPVVPE